ncbi:polysaccharide biosynthesis protein [Spirochaetota bacterium]
MKQKQKILIVGAGEAGRMLLSEYDRRGRSSSVIGFVDDDKSKIDSVIEDKRVFNTIDNIDVVIKEYSINQAIIAIPSADSTVVNRIVSDIISTDFDVNIYIVPSVERYFDRVPLFPSLSDLALGDLLGRDEYLIDVDLIQDKFKGRTVLITGAGGSIGSEICKQILKFDIDKLIAIGKGEHSIYTLAKSLNEYISFMKNKPEIIYRIADVRDNNLMGRIFKKYNPHIVFHAAAHKHVPLMEFNELEAVQNNVLGTLNILDLSSKYGVNEFVQISTDKAVNPLSIMGATKRLAELITDYYNIKKDLKTAVVRFGNVIGSRGSVVPLFKEQIEKGGPVTVTDPEIKRYFMSIQEASILVINAAALSGGGEIYVLDMGKQYKVVDVAKKLIELYGYVPDKDIKIEFTGLRPGEKLYEELFYDKENLLKTENEKIFVLNRDKIINTKIEKFIKKENKKIARYSSNEIRKMLKDLIGEYDFSDFSKADYSESKIVN